MKNPDGIAVNIKKMVQTETDPQKNMNQNRSFFNRWAKSYDSAAFQFWMRHFQEPIFKELDLKKKPKLLDISCGTGELLKKLQGKAQLYGVDLSEEMLAIARKKLSKNTTLLKADVHELPFKDHLFDYVISTEAFHHYHDQQKALHEMFRIAKIGGKVMIVDINFFLLPIHWLFQKLEPGCVKINSRKQIKVLFEKAGLKNIRQQRSFLFAVMTIGEK